MSAEQHPTGSGPTSQSLHEDHGEDPSLHGEEEAWLVSYADLMTLLFGFFAMLFTFATFEDDAYIRMRKEVARYFGGLNAQTAGGAQKDQTGGNGPNPASIITAGDLKQTEQGLEVAMISGMTFKPGGTEMTEEAQQALKGLVMVVNDLTVPFKRVPEIRIEGHTDDIPLSNRGPFKSNWELSAARAGAIAQQLVTLGLRREQLTALGFGESRPVLPNRDRSGKPIPENMERNRRVVLKVIFPKSLMKEEETPQH